MTSESSASFPIRNVAVKYGDKGDQHDSGIDNSENLNSAESSSRSSPSAENKLRLEESKVCQFYKNNSFIKISIEQPLHYEKLLK